MKRSELSNQRKAIDLWTWMTCPVPHLTGNFRGYKVSRTKEVAGPCDLRVAGKELERQGTSRLGLRPHGLFGEDTVAV